MTAAEPLPDDQVGHISTLHLQIADQSPVGSYDARCLKLAELASHAVDFSKSGVAVQRTNIPSAGSRMRPDFLITSRDNAERDTYASMKALGKLFRAVPVRTLGVTSVTI